MIGIKLYVLQCCCCRFWCCCVVVTICVAVALIVAVAAVVELQLTAYVGRRDFFDDGYKVDIVGKSLVGTEIVERPPTLAYTTQ